MKEVHVGDSTLFVSEELFEVVDFENEVGIVIGDEVNTPHALFEFHGTDTKLSIVLHSIRVSSDSVLTLVGTIPAHILPDMIKNRKASLISVFHGDTLLYSENRLARRPALDVEAVHDGRGYRVKITAN